MLQRAQEMQNQFIEYRRQFHRHPEAGWKEEKTAAAVMAHLDSLDIPYTRIGATAVVGLIQGGIPGGKCIAIRADMDALSVAELSDAEYASEVPGMMHACGHDGHTAILMGVASLLKEKQAEFQGAVKLLFQPAEEGPGGAGRMIEGGCLENPKVDAAIGLHLNTVDYYTGELALKDGAASAGTDSLNITITGYGGHGASPHLSVDAIVCAAQVVTALQSIASREISPNGSVVVTIGTIQGGYRGNVIADKVTLSGTVRTLDPVIRNSIPERVKRIVENIAAAYRCTGEVNMRFGYPSIINDVVMTAAFEKSAQQVLGVDKVKRIPEASMGGEDFSLFAEKVPACFARLGGRNEEKGCIHPGHNPRYNFDEDAIAFGMAAMAQMALDYLSGKV